MILFIIVTLSWASINALELCSSRENGRQARNGNVFVMLRKKL
jgi:hypothetical protein